MSPKLTAAIVHVVIVAATIAGAVSIAAASIPGDSIPAGYIAAITAACAVVIGAAHALTGYFTPGQPPTTKTPPPVTVHDGTATAMVTMTIPVEFAIPHQIDRPTP